LLEERFWPAGPFGVASSSTTSPTQGFIPGKWASATLYDTVSSWV
jgi:hypothetical protein